MVPALPMIFGFVIKPSDKQTQLSYYNVIPRTIKGARQNNILDGFVENWPSEPVVPFSLIKYFKLIWRIRPPPCLSPGGNSSFPNKLDIQYLRE